MAYQASLGVVALTRFGYGPRGDGDAAIATGDPRGFLKAELMQPGIALLSGPELPNSKTAIQQFFGDQARRKAQREKVAAIVAESQPPTAAPMELPKLPSSVTEAMRQANAGRPPAMLTKPGALTEEAAAGKAVKAQNKATNAAQKANDDTTAPKQ